ncbi:MAG: DegT/DnrJ/EryC1/StrS family aminotransferase, partial [Anaerolineaceae bacterium]|nr:DegT/DnrJ/EryC1/StrS family aminotransferase [Anaerolineaceae bacterium]
MSQLAVLGGSQTHTTGWPDWPQNSPLEEAAALRVLRSGEWWRNSFGESIACADSGAEPRSEVARLELDFARLHGCRYGVANVNGSAALELALRAAGVGAGDEVIVPPYTFIATALAPLMVGAVPIFADIEPDTCNLDPERVRQAITPRTRAIIPVHFGGLPANMEAILAIAAEYGLAVIEDCAHAHGGAYRGKGIGSLGSLGAFSFQGSKNMTAGEGGMIITNDRAAAELAQSYAWGGRMPGSGWYGHVNLGTNLRLSEIQAAILSAQLQRLPGWFDTRLRSGSLLDSLLSGLPGVKPMAPPEQGSTHAYHLYLFRYFPEQFQGLPKADFVRALEAEGIPASTGYGYPLYRNPVFSDKRFWPGGYPLIPGVHEDVDYRAFQQTCPAAEQACASEIVWLPQSAMLAGPGAMEDIAAAIEKIRE